MPRAEAAGAARGAEAWAPAPLPGAARSAALKGPWAPSSPQAAHRPALACSSAGQAEEAAAAPGVDPGVEPGVDPGADPGADPPAAPALRIR